MTEFEKRVDATLQSMDGKLDELIVWKAVLNERCGAHREQTDNIRTVLFENNPNPGLVSKVNSLTNCKKDIQETQKLWKTTLIYILSRLLVVGIIALISWLLLVYKVIEIGGQ